MQYKVMQPGPIHSLICNQFSPFLHEGVTMESLSNNLSYWVMEVQ